MNAYIKHISYYLPDKIITNKDIVRDFPEWNVNKIASKIGIDQRHIASENETASDLAFRAAEKLFNESTIRKDEVDFIMFCTQSPDYILPTSACIIQDKLKLSNKCGALDFNLGCSGYIYGLSLAKGLICSGIAKNVLFLTGETYSKHIHPKDKGNRTIFGDAASATLISTEGKAEILNFSLGTDGAGYENLIIRNGGARNYDKALDLNFDNNYDPFSSNYLYMNGSEIFNFTIDVVPELIVDVLKVNHLFEDDISLYVFHQANKYMLNYLRKKMNIDESKFYFYMSDVGNTVSSTIPIALVEANRKSLLNNYVVLAGFGVGYSWGGVALKFKTI